MKPYFLFSFKEYKQKLHLRVYNIVFVNNFFKFGI